jgi:hypothetical protein
MLMRELPRFSRSEEAREEQSNYLRKSKLKQQYRSRNKCTTLVLHGAAMSHDTATRIERRM